MSVEDIRKSLCVFLGHLSSGSINPGISTQSTPSYIILNYAEWNGYTLPFDTFHNKAREFLINHILAGANCKVGEGITATTLIYFSWFSIHFWSSQKDFETTKKTFHNVMQSSRNQTNENHRFSREFLPFSTVQKVVSFSQEAYSRFNHAHGTKGRSHFLPRLLLLILIISQHLALESHVYWWEMGSVFNPGPPLPLLFHWLLLTL